MCVVNVQVAAAFNSISLFSSPSPYYEYTLCIDRIMQRENHDAQLYKDVCVCACKSFPSTQEHCTKILLIQSYGQPHNCCFFATFYHIYIVERRIIQMNWTKRLICKGVFGEAQGYMEGGRLNKGHSILSSGWPWWQYICYSNGALITSRSLKTLK